MQDFLFATPSVCMTIRWCRSRIAVGARCVHDRAGDLVCDGAWMLKQAGAVSDSEVGIVFMSNVEVRRLAPGEWAATFPLIVQLRPHLDQAEFKRRVERQSYGGYELVGAFRGGRLVGVLGMRPVHTLMRGPHLHIDDIVVDEAERQSGCGRR
jgi:hypothetical protein